MLVKSVQQVYNTHKQHEGKGDLFVPYRIWNEKIFLN